MHLKNYSALEQFAAIFGGNQEIVHHSEILFLQYNFTQMNTVILD